MGETRLDSPHQRCLHGHQGSEEDPKWSTCLPTVVCAHLGPNNVDNMAGEAETVLKTVQYHGEKRQWNFEKYARTHLRQHLILGP